MTAPTLARHRRTTPKQEEARRLLLLHDEERASVAGELHEDALQRVALIGQELEALTASLSGRATPDERHRLRGLNEELLDLAVTLRNLAERLHPTALDQLGLPRALRALASEVGQATGIRVEVVATRWDIPLSPQVARVAYRIAEEALRNVAAHSGARTAEVEVSGDALTLVLRVRDAGRGFLDGSDGARGAGIAAMRARAASINGSLRIRSRLGAGTTVVASLPRHPDHTPHSASVRPTDPCQ